MTSSRADRVMAWSAEVWPGTGFGRVVVGSSGRWQSPESSTVNATLSRGPMERLIMKRMLNKPVCLAFYLAIATVGIRADESTAAAPDRAPPDAASSLQSAHDETTLLFLRKATGDLRVSAEASVETYEAYFMIPIAYGDQAPVLLTVTSPQLIDYRFLRLTPPNVIVAGTGC
jgi:hypothetical protein